MTDSLGTDGDIVSTREIAAALPDTPTVRFIQDHFEQFGGIKVGRKYYFPPNWKEVLFNGAKPTFPQHPPAPELKMGLEKDRMDQKPKGETVLQRGNVRIVRTGISKYGARDRTP